MENSVKHIQSFAHILNPSFNEPKKIWVSKPKSINSINKQQETQLFESIQYENPPSLVGFSINRDFFTILCKIVSKQKISINFPETLVFGYGFTTPTLLYTDLEGVLRVKTNLKFNHFETIYKIFELHRQNAKKSFHTPLAIVKSTITGSARIIMKASEFLAEIGNGLKSGAILQRFVVPKGNKAFKVRVFNVDSSLKGFGLCSKNRFDRKMDRKPAKVKKPRVSGNIPKIGISASDETNDIIFHKKNLFVARDSSSRLDEMNEMEVINMGQKYLDEKNFALAMIEMETSGFNEKVIHVPRKKKPDQRPSNSNQIVRRQRASTYQMNEIDKYFDEIWSSCLFIDQSLKDLHKELESSSPLTSFLSSLNEENLYSNFVIYRLKYIYLIDISDPERFSITSLPKPGHNSSIESCISTLKKSISSKFLSRNNSFIDSIVADFCEDYSGNFYFIDIKSFTIKSFNSAPVPILISIKDPFRCPGRFCRYKSYAHDDSIDTISQENFHVPKIFKILASSLKESEEKDLQNLIKCNYDRTVDVCEDCFKRYMKIEQDKLKKVMKSCTSLDVKKFRFAKSIGNIKMKSLKQEAGKEERSRSSVKLLRRNKDFDEIMKFAEKMKNDCSIVKIF